MSDFKDLSEVFDPDLYLPINGKTYRIPNPDARTGLKLILVFQAGLARTAGVEVDARIQKALTDAEDGEDQWWRDTLGTALDDMLADGVGLDYVNHAAQTAQLAWTVGKDTAAAYWNRETPGKAAGAPRTTATRTGAAAETTTPSPASPTTTTAKPRGKGKAAPRR